jgi:hypothetical protein
LGNILEQPRFTHPSLSNDKQALHSVEVREREFFLAGVREHAAEYRPCAIEVKDHTPRSALRSRFPSREVTTTIRCLLKAPASFWHVRLCEACQRRGLRGGPEDGMAEDALYEKFIAGVLFDAMPIG